MNRTEKNRRSDFLNRRAAGTAAPFFLLPAQSIALLKLAQASYVLRYNSECQYWEVGEVEARGIAGNIYYGALVDGCRTPGEAIEKAAILIEP